MYYLVMAEKVPGDADALELVTACEKKMKAIEDDRDRLRSLFQEIERMRDEADEIGQSLPVDDDIPF